MLYKVNIYRNIYKNKKALLIKKAQEVLTTFFDGGLVSYFGVWDFDNLGVGLY